MRPFLTLSLLLVPILACRDGQESPTTPTADPVVAGAAVAEPLAFRQISAGLRHTCGVTTGGQAYCWGDNTNGQLGDGTSMVRSRPVAVMGGIRFILVSAGVQYTCGIATDERAWCWGQNTNGQLGDGTTTKRLRPVQVAGGRRFHQVRAGDSHTCAVNLADAAFCWGLNGNGQVGDGTTISRHVPVRVKGTLTFRRVFVAGRHSCGATLDNRGYCWGRNDDGQLGDGTMSQRLKPVAVTGGHRFTQVMVGAGLSGVNNWISVSCGLTTGDRAYCWGDNGAGAVGDGTAGSGLRRPRPVAVVGGLLFNGVSTGGVHTCGVSTENLAYCWGSNGNFQLGDGGPSDPARTSPTAVVGGLRFRAITAGTLHTCALTTEDQAFCWGNNFSGQLGIGSVDTSPFTPKSTPRAVVGPA